MNDISLLSDDELDALLMAQVKDRQQKVAMVIAMAMRPYESWDEDRVGDRIRALGIIGDRPRFLERYKTLFTVEVIHHLRL